MSRFLLFGLMWLQSMMFFGAHEAAMAIEKADYVLVEKDGDIELRQYEPYIVAETFVEGNFSDAGNTGFRRLYDYISGNNRGEPSVSMTSPVPQEGVSQKIDMTAPVNQEQMAGKWRITFLMPAGYTMGTLPEPLDPDVALREEPGGLVAALRYSGTWSRRRYVKKEEQLREWIKSRGLSEAGAPIFARYNPPLTPWFLRRNEVLISVER